MLGVGIQQGHANRFSDVVANFGSDIRSFVATDVFQPLKQPYTAE